MLSLAKQRLKEIVVRLHFPEAAWSNWRNYAKLKEKKHACGNLLEDFDPITITNRLHTVRFSSPPSSKNWDQILQLPEIIYHFISPIIEILSSYLKCTQVRSITKRSVKPQLPESYCSCERWCLFVSDWPLAKCIAKKEGKMQNCS